ncbi:MAG: UTP--glucose-1-phosphate uridylyltransferase [Limisphaerales bacterium]
METEMKEIEEAIRDGMLSKGIKEDRIAAFIQDVQRMAQGEEGLIPESSLEPVGFLPQWEAASVEKSGSSKWLDQLVTIKLNGGLGTSMGLERAKSLLPIRAGHCFLGLIAQQILHLREHSRRHPRFCLMNSFSTHQDSLDWLQREVPALRDDLPIDFLQGQVPKLDAESWLPVQWPKNPELAWCPPGHGDLYLSLLSSGMLDRLIASGAVVAFVSNADNLGAAVDLSLLDAFMEGGSTLMMEVARRTPSDRKGGHLARRQADGQLILRESAQCQEVDKEAFQDIERHAFFNTNNLWLRLDHLRDHFNRHGAHLELPLIRNFKTVDPTDPSSPKVIQLESAMGSAIQCFEETSAIEVPRSRFSPVKTTGDLLALRSDAYELTKDFRIQLHEDRQGIPPRVVLEPAHYGHLAQFEACFGQGIPSMLQCDSLLVEGPVRFESGVVLKGSVTIQNRKNETQTIEAGCYENASLSWS